MNKKLQIVCLVFITLYLAQRLESSKFSDNYHEEDEDDIYFEDHEENDHNQDISTPPMPKSEITTITSKKSILKVIQESESNITKSDINKEGKWGGRHRFRENAKTTKGPANDEASQTTKPFRYRFNNKKTYLDKKFKSIIY